MEPFETTDVVGAAEVGYRALREIGRDDLASRLMFRQDSFTDPDGPWYLEPLDDVSDADYQLMVKACSLGLDRAG